MSAPKQFTKGDPANDAIPEAVEQRIRRLVEGESYAVLCTQGQGQPYGSLVAYAMESDLKHAVFATPKATRKYRLLTECDHVAMVIDNRSEFGNELMEIEAVTVTGRANEITDDRDLDRWSRVLVNRHSYLRRFAGSESCSVFVVEILRYFHVGRFQEVHQWVP